MPRKPKSPPKMVVIETVIGTENKTDKNINNINIPATAQTPAPAIEADTPAIHDGLPVSEFLADIEQPFIEDQPVVPVIDLQPNVAPIVNEDKPPVKKLVFRLSVDQIGMDVPNAITNKLYSEFTAIATPEKPVDIAFAAGHMAKHLFPQLRLFKDKKAGFNVGFYIENSLIEGFNSKSKGNFKMATQSDLAFGIANLILAATNIENDDAIFTKQVKNNAETIMFVDRLGLKEARNLPSFMLADVIDVKRKGIKKYWQTAKKAAIASVNN